MYNVIIKTNIPSLPQIHLKVEDLNDPKFIEITEQPYVLETRAELIREVEDVREQDSEGYIVLSKKK